MLYPLSYGRMAPKGLTESSVEHPCIEIGPEQLQLLLRIPEPPPDIRVTMFTPSDQPKAQM
jgi:hypothetical protein